MHRISAIFSALAGGLLLTPGAVAEPEISGAWVRAMPPTQSMTAAYLTLDNPGERAVTIIGASSDASPRVEIHTTVSRDGMQRMQPVDRLEVAAGARVDLAPGGYHLMLRDMPTMPAEGDPVELCLELDTGRSVCVTAAVSRGTPAADGHHHH